MIKPLFLYLFFITTLFVNAQVNIPIESWRIHVSYNSTTRLAGGDNKIFAAASNGVFYLDKDDNSINTITKLEGLSDVAISALAYSDSNNALIIGYENGNIDVWENKNIVNLSALLNANLAQSKTIHHFNILNKKCYISTDFGILILDLETLTIQESIQNLGANGETLKIYESTIHNDSLFLATQAGVIATSLSPNLNILDYNNWKHFNESDGIPISEMASITTHAGRVYAAERNGNIYSFQDNVWSAESFSQNNEHINLFGTNDYLTVATSNSINTIKNGQIVTSIVLNTILTSPNFAMLDNDLSLWIADDENGLLTNKNGQLESILPEGPYSDQVSKLFFHNNKMFALSGGISSSGLPQNNTYGFYVYENGFWTNFNFSNTPIFAKNLVDITFNPSDNNYYLASYGDGLLKFDGDKSFELFDTTNSQLQPWRLNNQHLLVSSVQSSANGIWVANYGTSAPLHFIDNTNKWKSYSQSSIITDAPVEIEIAENGDKWIQIDPLQNGKISVFNESSGKTRLLDKSIGNGDLPDNNVYDIEIDQEGKIWVGTDKGVAYFTSSYSIENQNSVDAFTPIVGGFPLLRDERITSIAIDGGNRKWFGSNNGLWLFDANVQNEVYFFNIENSPLISNNIKDIAIHELSGEVFIATDKGIVSFRSPATIGFDTHKEVIVFPNPVLSSFEGIVGISGLVEDSHVKITNISGKLIRQLNANGGTAGWDVKDYNGRRAETGMYLIFSSSSNGEETFIGKIAVVE